MGLDGKDTVTSSMISSSSSSASLPLEGRVAIVTGGSRGIGRAISVHLRSLGAKLVINYASNSTLANLLATQLNNNNNNNNNTVSVDSLVAITVQADVSNPDQVKLLFDRAEEAYGCPPHIIVCCAGVLDPNYPTIANTPLQDWDRTFNINTRGTFICCQEAAKRLKQGGGGRIIVISSSVVGSLPPGYGSYTASKAAVEVMTKILAKELKGTGITANCVAPGAVATDLFYEGKSEEAIKRMIESCPMGRLGETDDVAPIVGMLAADAGGWINGQVVRVNGGSVI